MHVPCSSTSISQEDSAFTCFSILDRDSSLLLHTHTHTHNMHTDMYIWHQTTHVLTNMAAWNSNRLTHIPSVISASPLHASL